MSSFTDLIREIQYILEAEWNEPADISVFGRELPEEDIYRMFQPPPGFHIRLGPSTGKRAVWFKDYSNNVEVEGTIHHQSGEEVGQFSRVFYRRPDGSIGVKHVVLDIYGGRHPKLTKQRGEAHDLAERLPSQVTMMGSRDWRGAGIGHHMIKSAITPDETGLSPYEKLGVRHVRTHAMWDGRGYWPRFLDYESEEDRRHTENALYNHILHYGYTTNQIAAREIARKHSVTPQEAITLRLKHPRTGKLHNTGKNALLGKFTKSLKLQASLKDFADRYHRYSEEREAEPKEESLIKQKSSMFDINESKHMKKKSKKRPKHSHESGCHHISDIVDRSIEREGKCYEITDDGRIIYLGKGLSNKDLDKKGKGSPPK